ncbi:hypothetical protein ACKKBG_A15180 [Auxenochlorella protothecoides x Auxenochlorella symbiontica]
MALPPLPLALLTLVGACLSLATNDAALVTCGSLIKLQHVATSCRLHSHDIPYGYGRGSGQQSVTCYPDSDSGESYWRVACEGAGKQGEAIVSGRRVRLQHGHTRKWLHSHHFISPLSGNQEVSCFGSDTETDTGDVWLVEWDSSKKASSWIQDLPVSLTHVDTGFALSSNGQQFQRPIHGHTEVYAAKAKKSAAKWMAAEGVYLPSSAPK